MNLEAQNAKLLDRVSRQCEAMRKSNQEIGELKKRLRGLETKVGMLQSKEAIDLGTIKALSLMADGRPRTVDEILAKIPDHEPTVIRKWIMLFARQGLIASKRRFGLPTSYKVAT